MLAEPSPWTDLLIYGGLVAFHWWAGAQDPPHGEAAELPRLIGSGVALIALVVGLQGVLQWLFEQAYEATVGTIVDQFLDARSGSAVAGPLGLLIAAAPIWAWRWLTTWNEEPRPLRHLYLGTAAVSGLVTFLGTGVAIVTLVITYFLGTLEARLHFAGLPAQLSALIVGVALWAHHRRRMGADRSGAVRGYEYTMAAIGLGALVGAGTSLVAIVLETPLAGDPGQSGLIGAGLAALVSGAVWRYFWRNAQRSRVEERRSPQRRFYLVGMAVILGLTTAGALIAVLVIAFQAALAEGASDLGSLPIPVTLTVLAGIATWHLFTVIRSDGPADTRIAGAPFEVTVICSHPGPLAVEFPKEAVLRVVYRNDEAGNRGSGDGGADRGHRRWSPVNGVGRPGRVPRRPAPVWLISGSASGSGSIPCRDLACREVPQTDGLEVHRLGARPSPADHHRRPPHHQLGLHRLPRCLAPLSDPGLLHRQTHLVPLAAWILLPEMGRDPGRPVEAERSGRASRRCHRQVREDDPGHGPRGDPESCPVLEVRVPQHRRPRPGLRSSSPTSTSRPNVPAWGL